MMEQGKSVQRVIGPSGDMCDMLWSSVASMMPMPCGHDAGSPVPFPALFGWSVTGEDGDSQLTGCRLNSELALAVAVAVAVVVARKLKLKLKLGVVSSGLALRPNLAGDRPLESTPTACLSCSAWCTKGRGGGDTAWVPELGWGGNGTRMEACCGIDWSLCNVRRT